MSEATEALDRARSVRWDLLTGGLPEDSYRMEIIDRWARFMLKIGYGTDMAFRESDRDGGAPIRPPLAVLERMVEFAADDPSFISLTDRRAGIEVPVPVEERREEAYFCLMSEIGDWRAGE